MYIILRYKKKKGYWRVCHTDKDFMSHAEATLLYEKLCRLFPTHEYKLLRVTEVVCETHH